MRKNPSTRWFFKDWENDPGIKACSFAARGLWISMLCICAENDGFLLVAGKRPSLKTLALRLGIEAKTARKLLLELHENDVYSIDENGVIYNRRMARAHDEVGTSRTTHAREANPQGKARSSAQRHTATSGAHRKLPRSIKNPSSSSESSKPRANGDDPLHMPVPIADIVSNIVNLDAPVAAPRPNGRSAPSALSMAQLHFEFLRQHGKPGDAEEYFDKVDRNGIPNPKFAKLVQDAIDAMGWSYQQEEHA